MSDSPVARMSIVIDYEDGSRQTYQWVNEVKPVDFRVTQGMGERHAEAGAFTIEVSRWPGNRTFQPGDERVRDTGDQT